MLPLYTFFTSQTHRLSRFTQVIVKKLSCLRIIVFFYDEVCQLIMSSLNIQILVTRCGILTSKFIFIKLSFYMIVDRSWSLVSIIILYMLLDGFISIFIFIIRSTLFIKIDLYFSLSSY